MASLLLEIENLAFRYRDALSDVLQGISFNQQSGEFLALVGASGAGKSTLCRCVNRIIPTFHKGDLRGRIRVCGDSIAGKTVAQLVPAIGMVFQDFETQLFSTDVSTEVAFGLENLGTPPDAMQRRVREALALVGLSGLEHREPATLSGGQKQRLALAAVLAMSPELLILDEPTTDLDPAGKVEVLQLAMALKQAGSSILCIDHDLDDLPEMADRVLVLHEGQLVMEGLTTGILRQPEMLERFGVRPPQVAAFFQRAGAAEIPITVAEGMEYFAGARWHVNHMKAKSGTFSTLPAPGAEPLLTVRGVSFHYPGGVTALQEINLNIFPGEILAILGQNGSGKTTLAKLLNGLLTPTEGDIVLRGQSLKSLTLTETGREIGFVFQNPDHQIFAQTVRQEVEFAPRNLGLPVAQLPERINRTLLAVGLQGKEECNPFTMTKGERQRIAVASILAAEPGLIVLDEPTTGLDYREQVAMMALIRQLHAAGHTIVLITHSMWVAAEYAPRCVVMSQGRILADGATHDIFRNAAVLEESHLRAPAITTLGNALGFPALSVDELLAVLEKG